MRRRFGGSLEREAIDFSGRNVLLSHQFYKNGSTSPETSDSEQVSLNVGGLDSVDVSLVENFDYVALGHIHGPQKVKVSPHPLLRDAAEVLPQRGETGEIHHDGDTGREGNSEPLIETLPLHPHDGMCAG